MIQRYEESQARRLRMALVADNVYCIVSDALKEQYPEKTQLNSVEIWMAAHGLTCDLIQSPAPEEIFGDLLTELEEEVSSFKFFDERSGRSTSGRLLPAGRKKAERQDSGFKNHETTLFLILMVSMCQISALRKKITNADALLRREMEVCRKHDMYISLLEKFDGKEIRMRMANRKIDLLNYEMKAVGNDKEKRQQMLDDFAQAASRFSPQNIESNLLVLNKINLLNGHIYDDKILEMYEQLEKKVEIQKTFEITMGNKNVAEAGGMQMNGDMPQDLAGFLAMYNNLKQLGDGRR